MIGSEQILKFGDFEIDLGRNELRHQGEPAEITQKPFEFLCHLARNHDRTVPKHELFDVIWPDTIVGGAALSSTLKAVRKALGDDGQRQQYIRTYRGRGYRFCQPVSLVPIQISPEVDPAPAASETFDEAGVRLIGRDAALRSLQGHVSQRCAPQHGLCLLVGREGMGKTALLDALGHDLAAGGFRVHRINCSHVHNQPPFSLWLPVLREWLQAVPRQRLDAELQSFAQTLERFAPGLWPGAPVRQEKASAYAELNRADLFGELARMLRIVGPGDRSVLLFDDLHYGDSASLELICFLASLPSGPPIAMVGALDERVTPIGQGSNRPLLSLRDQGKLERLELSAFDVAEAKLLLERRVDTVLPDAAIDALWKASGGNPGFLGDLVNQLARQNLATSKDEILRQIDTLPRSSAALCRNWLAETSEGARQLALVASLCGTFDDARLLVECSGLDECELPDRLEELFKAGIAIRTADGSAQLRSTEMASVLQQDVPEQALRALHRQIGLFIEQRGSEAEPGSAERSAYHLGEWSPTESLTAEVRAGGEAHARLAWEQAIAHLSRARVGFESGPRPPDSLRRRVLHQLGTALLATGCYREATEALREATQIAYAAGDLEATGRSVLALDDSLNYGRWENPDDQDYAKEVMLGLLGELGDAKPALRARLLAQLASAVQRLPDLPDFELSMDWFDWAAESASDSGELGPLLQVLSLRSRGLGRPAGVHQRVEYLDRIEPQLIMQEDRAGLRMLYECRVHTELTLGRLAEAEAALDRAEGSQDPRMICGCLNLRAALAFARGEFDSAAEAAVELIDEAKRTDSTFHINYGQTHLANIAFHRQSSPPDESDITAWLPEDVVDRRSTIRTLVLHVFAGQTEAARDLIRQTDLEFPATSGRGFISAAFYASVATDTGDEKRCARYRRILEPYAGFHALIGPVYLGPLDLTLGRLAMAVGDYEAAASHLSTALGASTLAGAHPFVATSLAAMAQLHSLRAGGRLNEASRECAERARCEAERIGMHSIHRWLEGLEG